MATSLPLFTRVTLNITLSNGTSSVTAITAVPAKPFVIRDIIYTSTESSPDGLLQINFHGAADGSRYLGGVYAADMGSDGDEGSLTGIHRLIDGGLWYQATGDGDSNGDVIEVTLALQSYSDR